MFEAIQYKFIEAIAYLENLKDNERGQTSAEYVAVTAVAVSIAITVIYLTLAGALSDGVSAIAEKITTFIDTPPAIPPPAPAP